MNYKRKGDVKYMSPKKYVVNKKVWESTLLKNGFAKNENVYQIQKYLYKEIIILTVIINFEEKHLAINVCYNNDNLYAPFYDPDVRRNNIVADRVIDNYNRFMDELVKKKILKHHKVNDLHNNGETIRIKYFSDQIEKLTYIENKSDWIDLRAAKDVQLKKGEFALIPLGVAMELPEGYEAIIAPRSSTFKNFGIIEVNSLGIIDESYCGDDDQWMMPGIAFKDTVIHINDRICQFRILKHQPHIYFSEVDKLNNKNRGGHGSTGKR